MRLAKISLSIILAVFVLGSAVYFNGQYEEYCHMQRIASLKMVKWDLKSVPFWTQNQAAINFFIVASILLSLGIAILHLADKEVKCVAKEVDTPRLTQALKKRASQ